MKGLRKSRSALISCGCSAVEIDESEIRATDIQTTNSWSGMTTPAKPSFFGE